jgi:C4-dicarboxylate transporter DctM subunit
VASYSSTISGPERGLARSERRMVLVVILLETAMITPPVGINLYVVQGLRTRGRIDDVIIGSAPFLITMLVMLALLSYWPDLALWLPRAASD